MKITFKFIAYMLLTCSFTYGQVRNYSYKREIIGISEQWHKIILPEDLFKKVSQDLTDIRIFGITVNNDTVEAPYLLRLTTEKISNKEIEFKILNTAHNDNGYYYSFEIPTTESINQIKLGFNQENFDWKINLEGSQNQKEWYTISENYRILSINNEITNFTFTKLVIPSSKFRFYRLLIKSNLQPELKYASIANHIVNEGTYRIYTIKKQEIKENKETKQTEINIEFNQPVPVCEVKINVKDSFDYYRPITIKYLSDSIKTEQGWKYLYNLLSSGILNSIEKKNFNFNSLTVQKLKIFIENHDNQPLYIDSLMFYGYVHELAVRFTEQGTYFLTYGNKKDVKPNYDIDRFIDKVPENLNELELGKEQKIEKEDIQELEPLFKYKSWLWAIMTIIIIILGWFSVKMIQK